MRKLNKKNCSLDHLGGKEETCTSEKVLQQSLTYFSSVKILPLNKVFQQDIVLGLTIHPDLIRVTLLCSWHWWCLSSAQHGCCRDLFLSNGWLPRSWSLLVGLFLSGPVDLAGSGCQESRFLGPGSWTGGLSGLDWIVPCRWMQFLKTVHPLTSTFSRTTLCFLLLQARMLRMCFSSYWVSNYYY